MSNNHNYFLISINSDSEETESASEEGVPDSKPESIKISKNPSKSNLDLLLDLSDIGASAPVMALSRTDYPNDFGENSIRVVEPVSLNNKFVELLNRISGNGLSAEYRFTRTPNLYSPKMANLNITFMNNTNKEITAIKLLKKVREICTF